MSDPLSIGFTGAFEDPVTRAYPLGNGDRWYLQSLMRFNGADELSPFDDGGPNPYGYCGDDPINHSDPTGHISLSVLTRLFGADATALSATTARESASDAPIALERATGSNLDAPPPYDLGAPPEYVEPRNRVGLPPPYSQAVLHPSFAPGPTPRRPRFRSVRNGSIYEMLDRNLTDLRDEMRDEMLRIEGRHLGRESRLPSVGYLIAEFFLDRSNWRRLRDRRAAELARRAERLHGYRIRLRSLKQQINEDPRLDRVPTLRAELQARLKRTKRLYTLLEL